ncbi:flagellar basal body P-ring formation chaperone FlgA [Nitrospira sp. Kam-Ns4a]
MEVHILGPRQPILLPPGAVTARVTEQGPETHAGPRSFTLTLAVDGKPVRTVTVTAAVEAQAEAVAPVRLIRKDDLLEEADLAVMRVPLTEEHPEFVWRLEDAVGKRAVRALPPHQPLRPSSLGAPYAVRKGERVVIEAKRGGLTVRTAGVTKAGGVVGQSIVVTNVDSGKQLQATVIAPGVVQVEF